MIGTELRRYLLARSDVSALIDDRIYPEDAKEGKPYPRILYTENGGQRTGSLSGANEQVQTSFELLCQSESSDEAKSIRDALENVLDYFRGTMGATTVQGVFCRRDPDGSIPPTAGNDNTVYESRLTLDLWYEKAVPNYV